MKQLILLCIMLCLPHSAWADLPTLYYNGRPLDIKVTQGKITEVLFPQKVAKIVKGGGADSVLIEVMDYSVFILPKHEMPADIFVTDIKGESYPLNLIISEEHEAKVKVAYAFDPNRLASENRGDVMDLMKLLMQGVVPAGATVLEGNEKRIIAQGQIELSLRTVFELPKLNGLVLTARNLTSNAVVVPIQNIAYARLMAISADADTLNPTIQDGDQSKIYMVVER